MVDNLHSITKNVKIINLWGDIGEIYMREREIGIGVPNLTRPLGNALHNLGYRVQESYERLGKGVRETTGLKLTSDEDGTVNGVQFSPFYVVREPVDTDNLSQPTIIYHESLDRTPYQIDLDAKAIGVFLYQHGMSPTKIAGKDITVKIKQMSPAGSFDASGNSITLNPGGILGRLDKDLVLVNKIVGDEIKPKSVRFSNLHTKRLPHYLVTVTPERAIPFAQKLLVKVTQRDANACLRHELRHMVDYSLNSILFDISYLLPFVLGGVAGMMAAKIIADNFPVPSNLQFLEVAKDIALVITIGPFTAFITGYIFSPMEWRAYWFMDKSGKGGKWQSLITITPKETPEKRGVRRTKSNFSIAEDNWIRTAEAVFKRFNLDNRLGLSNQRDREIMFAYLAQQLMKNDDSQKNRLIRLISGLSFGANQEELTDFQQKTAEFIAQNYPSPEERNLAKTIELAINEFVAGYKSTFVQEFLQSWQARWRAEIETHNPRKITSAD